ncbi:MAG TPA: thiolase family protein [Gemmatimonadaceae bacterium]|nr:thiolase family protein [Gemmatimonadaceae bacterium]HVP70995.1 thiolase family protein [Gemmatimonadaceae bacterium]
MTQPDIVFLSAVRTGFGTFGGSLKDISAIDLAVFAAQEAMTRAKVDPGEIGQSVFGNVMQTTSDTIYFARHVALKAGCPNTVPALTVNRLCGSGFQAVVSGAMEILLDRSDVCLVGGGENMSLAPHIARGIRWGTQLGKSPVLEDSLWEGLRDPVAGLAMAETAEKLGAQYELTRAQVDEYALRSQAKAKEAWASGIFDDEVIGIPVKDPKTKQMVEFRRDEHMRPDTSKEGLAKLKPVFKQDGLVTAGNASGIGDGGGALVIASAEWAKKNGKKPLARLVNWGVAGVDPTIMGIGPVPATKIALERAKMTLDQMDMIEINEAFAPQVVACETELKVPREKFNMDGGAIAISHPLAASGARITAHLIHALRKRGKRYGLGSACIGGGQGISVIIEALG